MIKVKANILRMVLFFMANIFIINICNFFFNMDYAALGVYIFFLIFIYHYKKEMLIKYMFMFVMFSYHIGSVFIVENFTNYLYNLQTLSYRSGAFVPIVTSYIIGFVVLLMLESNSNSVLLKKENVLKDQFLFFNGRKISEKQLVKIITVLLLIITLVIVARIGSRGFYSMGGIDRFEYRSQVFSGFDARFYTYISWLLPIPLMCANLGMKKRAGLFFALYCFYLIWIGDKFGSIFLAFYFYLLVNWSIRDLNKKFLRRVILLVFAVLIVLMIFVSYQVLFERGSWLEVWVYFNHRLTGGQSDLWWGVYSQEKNGWWRIGEFFKDELSAVFTQPASMLDYNFGIYKMMRVTAPDWVVYNYLSKGARFAASTQASLFYYFKYTGLYLGSMLMFILYFNVVNRAINAYKSNDIVRSVCYTMFISKAIQLTTMSGIDMLGNATTWLGIIILLVLYQKEKHTNSN